MASEVLYIFTGVVFVVMAAHHLLKMRVGPHTTLSHGTIKRDFIHDAEWMRVVSLHWTEGAVCAGILLFGIWLTISGSLSLFSIARNFN